MKPGSTADHYSIDRPINLYLKRHVSELSVRFTFCHVFRITVTCKNGQNDFNAILLPNSPENHALGQGIFHIICLNHENRIILDDYRRTFFKNFNVKKMKEEKSFNIVWLTRCCDLCYLWKSKISIRLDEAFQRY